MLKRLLKSESLQMMIIVGVGMIFGLIFDIYLAKTYGTNFINDSIIIGISLPIFLDVIFREGTRLSLIPIFINSKNQKTEQILFVYSVLLGGILLILALSFSKLIINFFGKDLPLEALQLSNSIFVQFSFALFFIPQSAVLSARLNAKSEFNIVALRNLIVPSFALAWILMNPQESIHSIPQGMFGGIVAYYLLLITINIKKGFSLNGLFKNSSKVSTNQLYGSTILPIAGLSVKNGAKMYERTIATQIGAGGVSAYYFAFKIISAIQGIMGLSFATIGSVKFSKIQNHKINNVLKSQLIRIFIIMIPLSILLNLTSNFIIEVLFSSGNFNLESIQQTTMALKGFSFGLSFLVANPTLSAALYAKNKYVHLLGNTIVISAIGLFIAILMTSQWGLLGLAYSISLTAVLSFLYLLALNIIYKF